MSDIDYVHELAESHKALNEAGWEIERLRAENEKLQEAKRSAGERITGYIHMIEQREAEILKLRAALIAVYRLMDMDGSDIDCCDLQDKLIEHGVVVEYTATEPCCDSCTCEEYGPEFPMKCYRLNDDLRAAAAALKETGE